MRCRFRMLLALLLAAAPTPLFADPRLAEAMGRIDPRPGAWAEYLVRAPGHDDLRVRATVLADAADGRHWLELITASAGGDVSAARVPVGAGATPSPGHGRLSLIPPGHPATPVPLHPTKVPPSPPTRPPPSLQGAEQRREQKRGLDQRLSRFAGVRKTAARRGHQKSPALRVTKTAAPDRSSSFCSAMLTVIPGFVNGNRPSAPACSVKPCAPSATR